MGIYLSLFYGKTAHSAAMGQNDPNQLIASILRTETFFFSFGIEGLMVLWSYGS